MAPRWLLFVALAALQTPQPQPAATDPFACLRPTIVLTDDERRALQHGDPISRVLPASDREIAVFAAVPVAVDGNRLVAWMRRIEALKASQYVLAIRRLSDPPRPDDLAALTLEDDDLDSIRDCKAGNCDLKLSAAEMTRLKQVADAAGRDWRPAVQAAFRDVVLRRIQAYAGEGLVPPYNDKKLPVLLTAKFTSVLGHLEFLSANFPGLTAHLAGGRPPATDGVPVESFFYWSKERLARKAVVSVTQVLIVRGRGPGEPDAITAGKQIYATHYMNASLGVTMILRGAPGQPNYLVYVNRSDADIPGGLFAGLVRYFVQRRLKSEAADVLRSLRQRLENGDPPAAAPAGRP